MNSRTFLMPLAACLVSYPAVAQDECARFVGTSVLPITIQQAATRVSELTPKDEFETTAQYEARIAAALETAGGPLIVGKALEDAQYLEYDADRSVLNVKSFALHNTTFNATRIWSYGGPLHGKVNYSTIGSSVAVAFADEEKTVGSYTGTNAFGVKTRVTQIDRFVWGVFDGDLPYGTYGIFEGSDNSRDLGEIALPPDEARALKQSAKVAYTMVPKAPFWALYEDYPSDATVSDPYEVTTTTIALFADIQCGLLTDAAGRVVLAAAVK